MATAARRRRGQRNRGAELFAAPGAESEGGSGPESRGRSRHRRCRRESHSLEAEAVRSPEELGALPGGDSPPATLRSVLLDSLLFYWGRKEQRREGT